jgi:acetone carboxylase, beta subunit
VYARSARSPELGYLITQAIVHGSVEVEKPALPELDETSGEPPVASTRTVRWPDGDAETSIIRLEDVLAGRDPRPRDRRALGDHVRDPAA